MKNINQPRKRRAMTSKDASRKKRQGHKDEEIFANLIGGKVIAGTGKQDVIDKNGKIYSVKGGEKKWQIFLYGENRFKSDHNIPVAELFIKCIESFPVSWGIYKRNKLRYKHALQPAMMSLKNVLSQENNKKNFLQKAFFNDKVDFLTIKDGNIFHIFARTEAIEVLNKSTSVENSKARAKGQIDALKVVFKLDGIKKTTIGEIELRTDRAEKFRLIKFWMFREKTLTLLKEKIKILNKKSNYVVVHGEAIKSVNY